MCLIGSYFKGKESIIKTAEKDIICYKEMKATFGNNYNFDLKFITPYQRMFVPKSSFNKVLENHDKVNIKFGEIDDVRNIYEVGGGVFHVFRNIDDAINDINCWGEGNVVFKAIIPKGTKYFIGKYEGSDIICFGTKAIKITDEILYISQYMREVLIDEIMNSGMNVEKIKR